MNDFLRFATSQGLNSMHVEKVMSDASSVSYTHLTLPTILLV